MELSDNGKIVLGWMIMGKIREGTDPDISYQAKTGKRGIQSMGIFKTYQKNGVIMTQLAHEGGGLGTGLDRCPLPLLMQHHMMDVAECLANGVSQDMVQYMDTDATQAFADMPAPLRIPTPCIDIFDDMSNANGRIVFLRGRKMVTFDGEMIDYSIEPQFRKTTPPVSYVLSECACENLDWEPMFQWGDLNQYQVKIDGLGNIFRMVGQEYESPEIVAKDEYTNEIRRFTLEHWDNMMNK